MFANDFHPSAKWAPSTSPTQASPLSPQATTGVDSEAWMATASRAATASVSAASEPRG